MILETSKEMMMELENRDTDVNENDLLPEYCRYRDEGCEYAVSCLNCPFPRCIYEETGGPSHWLKEQRNQEILQLHRSKNLEVRELAARFHVSQRTVQRILKNSRGNRAVARIQGNKINGGL